VSRAAINALLLTGALLASEGCFTPDIDALKGAFKCTTGADCPSGQLCDSKGGKPGKCYAPAPADASPGDLGPTGDLKPDRTKTGCGDGKKAATEACDGDEFGGATCQGLGQGFTGGYLLCNEKCTQILAKYCYKISPLPTTDPVQLSVMGNSSTARPALSVEPKTGEGLLLWADPGAKSTELDLKVQSFTGLQPSKYGYGMYITSTDAHGEREPALTLMGTEHLALWVDGRNKETDLYAGRVTIDVKNPAQLKDVGGVLVQKPGAKVGPPAIACADKDSCLVVWAEQITTTKWMIFSTLLTRNSSDMLTADSGKSTMLTTSTGGNNGSPVVATDGKDYQVAWIYNPGTGKAIMTARKVDGQGSPLKFKAKWVGGDKVYDVARPSIAYMSTPKLYQVVWQKMRKNGADIHGVRLFGNSENAKRDNTTSELLSPGDEYSLAPSVACAQDTCVVAFTSGKGPAGHNEVHAVRTTDDGKTYTEVDLLKPIFLSTGLGKVGSPRVAAGAKGKFVVTWRDAYAKGSTFIRARTLEP